MLVLYETSAGYALFKVNKSKKLEDADLLCDMLEDPAQSAEILKLKSFKKFKTMEEAVDSGIKLSNGKLPVNLKKFLKTEFKKGESKANSLIVSDTKLGSKIAEKLKIKVISDSFSNELLRGIRAQFSDLIPEIGQEAFKTMVVGLSHSISRARIQFSPEKVDVMIVQAINLLDDLDKESNIYIMRLKEWYGWHFPELAKIVTDNLTYAKTVILMKYRTDAAEMDFSSLHPPEIEEEIKLAAKNSVGTEISEQDLESILFLSIQILEISEYRNSLHEYLRERITVIAPNLTKLVGEIIGARLISHAGSLINLAKQAASTVQIIGSEKALFRALKTKHDTPKYGLIFHASLVGQAAPKLKGKIARVLAAKASLSARYDAFGDSPSNLNIGETGYKKVLSLLYNLEKNNTNKLNKSSAGKKQTEKYKFKPSRKYNDADDMILE